MLETEADAAGIRASIGEAFVPPHVVARVLAAERRCARLRTLLFMLPIALGLVLMIEPKFTKAVLITPLNSYVLWSMRLMGLAAGLAFFFSFDPPDRKSLSEWPRYVVLSLLVPAIGFAAMNAITWRAARWFEFGFSDQAYAAATYPIEGRPGFYLTKRGRVWLDPYRTGEWVYVRIPPEQARAIAYSFDRLCITLLQRRSSSGAIEIISDPWRPFIRASSKKIGPCPSKRD